eukprot:24923_1
MALKIVADLLSIFGTLDDNEYSQIRSSTLSNTPLCKELVKASIDWSVSNGLTMGSPTIPNTFIHAPYTLLPMLFNFDEHHKLSSISLIFHKLVDRLSRDSKFLISCIKPTASSDPDFTGKMLQLYEKQVHDNELNQPYQLGIFRNDFMKNALTKQWGQIELNTIAASFGCLSDLVFKLHEFLLSRYLKLTTEKLRNDCNIYRPSVNTGNDIASALATAARLVNVENPIVLVLVQAGDSNVSDQRRIEYVLWNVHNVKCIRRTLLDVYKTGKYGRNKQLIVDGYAVSVVYYRAGYTPNDYGKEGYEWKARELIEFSTAIKCPSIAYHLIGSKVFQTIFNKKEVLLRYLNEEEADALLSVFVKVYTLDGNARIVNDAKQNYENYVLKPQREGGGNNYYNEDIPKMLGALSPAELDAYILMERIYPEEMATVQVRNFKAFQVKAICEMGIYSMYLSNGEDGLPKMNKVSGTLVRTKQAQVTEGGVATGYAVLDSLLLSKQI